MAIPASDPARARAQVAVDDVGGALSQVAELLAAQPGLEVTATEIATGLAIREAVSPTNIGSGIAIPHFIDPKIKSAEVVVVTLSSPITWGRRTDPVDVVFGLSGTPSEPWRHVRSLAHLARLSGIPGFADRLRSATDDESLRRVFAEEAARHV
jgi:mannitol/fructose-specific phosphotransferase system IIA component (Ntr-type)